ncbi:MAG TPA: polysaccharide lyase family 7 protein [Stackebrandtia sp.]|jgi:hypothetical protein|uniref:polysaccharide lyase family 7 protein n=1 Tax=Stackebrandtia sp. TaxID=2023065 RepID=UPI002D4EBDD4|nr:polysaccharide lyase family 7 protein [Stackebrandtia sp.]HZE37256.1 polysaccharide lyase family 7 protein [Stackebrandtia sp.]
MKINRNKRLALGAALLVTGAAAVVGGQAWADGASSSAGGAQDCDKKPSEILDLANWYLTLPTGDEGHPDTVEQPDLDGFTADPYFTANADCDAVQFQAPVNGVTTENSKYPRSELREMDGSDEASWSSSEGTHTLVVEEAFTHLPEPGDDDRDIVVGAQIHGSDDDVTVFRLEGDQLWSTDEDEPHGTLLDEHYTLGTKFEAKFVVEDGKTHVFYNGEEKATLSKDYDGAYFKTGAYTQANCDNSDPCDESNFGQVEIYSAKVTHE